MVPAQLILFEDLAGLILYAADGVLNFAFHLIGFAFSLQLFVARQLSDAFFDVAIDVLYGTFNAIFKRMVKGAS